MANFKCDCGYKTSTHSVKIIVRGDDIVCDDAPRCVACKIPMKLDIEGLTVGDVSFSVNRFDSLPAEDKKRIIRERSRQHFEKFHKDDRELKRRDTIENIKQKFEEGIDDRG